MRSAESTRGLPDRAAKPQPQPLALVGDVLDALREAGCHGTAWFELDGADGGRGLPECPGADRRVRLVGAR